MRPVFAVRLADAATISAPSPGVAWRRFDPATSVTVPLGPALITLTDSVPPAVTVTGPLLLVRGVATVPTVTSSTSSIVMLPRFP